MPQRINIVGDLGTTKLASDSYDIDNIYLTEEGWVYRHFKSTDESRWWDEILVAGEVVKASNEPCEATNPPKLGTVAAPTFETGDDEYDIAYSEHQVTGTPGTYTTKVVTTGGGVPTLDDGTTPPPAPTLGTVTVTGASNVASGATESYSGSIDGTATDATFVVSADGGATVSGSDVTFPAGPATVTVTVTATSATASDSPATGTLSVTVAA